MVFGFVSLFVCCFVVCCLLFVLFVCLLFVGLFVVCSFVCCLFFALLVFGLGLVYGLWLVCGCCGCVVVVVVVVAVVGLWFVVVVPGWFGFWCWVFVFGLVFGVSGFFGLGFGWFFGFVLGVGQVRVGFVLGLCWF